MKKALSFKTVFLLFFALNTSNMFAQSPPVFISDSLQSILNQSLPAGFTNGGAVMEVHVPGQWTWNSSTGFAIAGITSGQPQTNAVANDKFRVGSITKMMVSTCILKLQEQGLLSIEDPISMHLRSTLVTDTIASSGVVKIRHLLNHTSGISNSGDNNSCQSDVLSNPLGAHSLEDAIFCGASQGEIFPPEFAWAYSNTNYSILAMIIENITGLSYTDYLTQTIITPLGLLNTEIPTTNQISSSHMGCYWNIGSWIDLTIINPTTYTGWADVVSNTSDLVIFMKALRNSEIINSSSLTQMQTLYPGTYDYGLGYDFYTLSDVSYTGHYGEVANTSGLFFANTSSELAPNGYYISYNFNVQGADMINKIDIPVLNFLKTGLFSNGLTSLENETQSLKVFPNPASSKINIATVEKNNVANMITLFDELGKIVFQEKRIGLTNYSFDCSMFNRGVYTISIQNESKAEFHKIVLN